MTSDGSGLSFLTTLDLKDVMLANRCAQPPEEVGAGLIEDIEDDDEFEEFGVIDERTEPDVDEAEIIQPWDKDESGLPYELEPDPADPSA